LAKWCFSGVANLNQSVFDRQLKQFRSIVSWTARRRSFWKPDANCPLEWFGVSASHMSECEGALNLEAQTENLARAIASWPPWEAFAKTRK
jgi:hypothetical protein